MIIEERIARVEARQDKDDEDINYLRNQSIEHMRIRRELHERLARLETAHEKELENNAHGNDNTWVMIIATSILSPLMVFLIQELIRLI